MSSIFFPEPLVEEIELVVHIFPTEDVMDDRNAV